MNYRILSSLIFNYAELMVSDVYREYSDILLTDEEYIFIKLKYILYYHHGNSSLCWVSDNDKLYDSQGPNRIDADILNMILDARNIPHAD